MAIIIILITISLSLAILFLIIFYWNMKSGQYDDTYTPSVRMLFDDRSVKSKSPKGSPVSTDSPPIPKQNK